MKRILVTGSAGFIGSHLVDRLLRDGNEVIGLDNYFTGNKNNLKHLINNSHFEQIRHDVTIPYSIECDEIYNLACPASPYHYQRYPVHTIKTSLVGMINALELAKKLNIPVLQASTSEVYGDPLEHPQKETYFGNVNPIGIRSCYDESKRCAETLCMDYHRQYEVNIKIARISNTYGPRMAINDGRVISNFIIQARKGEDITIYGDGSQTRSFMYVDDCVEGLIKLMNSDYQSPMNIGSSFEVNIYRIAKRIKELTKSKSKIIHKELPEDDPKKRQLDRTLARQILEWEPKITIHEGLLLTIDYFKKL